MRDHHNLEAGGLGTVGGGDGSVGIATGGLTPIREQHDHGERILSELVAHPIQNVLEAARDASEALRSLAPIYRRGDLV